MPKSEENQMKIVKNDKKQNGKLLIIPKTRKNMCIWHKIREKGLHWVNIYGGFPEMIE